MRTRATTLPVLAILLLLLACSSANTTRPERSAERPTVYLCEQPDGHLPASMLGDLVFHRTQILREAVYRPGADFDLQRIGASACSPHESDESDESAACSHWRECEKLDRACIGKAGVTYCDVRALSRILLTGAATIEGSEVYAESTGSGGVPIEGIASAKLVEALIASDREAIAQVWNTLRPLDPAFKKAHFDEATRRVLKLPATDVGVTLNGPLPQQQALAVYAAASTYTLAFIVGHELAHAYGRCPLTAPAKAERNGTIEKLRDAQAVGNGVCKLATSDDEVNADRCALRAVEAVDRGVEATALSPDDTTSLNFSRLVAKQSMTLVLINGLTSMNAGVFVPLSQQNMPTDSWGVLLRDARHGYLYPTLRLGLFFDALGTAPELEANLLHGAVGSLIYANCSCQEGPRAQTIGQAIGGLLAPELNAALQERGDHQDLECTYPMPGMKVGTLPPKVEGDGQVFARWGFTANGVSISCEQAGVDAVHLVVDGEPGRFDFAFRCEDGQGTTDQIPNGVYGLAFVLYRAGETVSAQELTPDYVPPGATLHLGKVTTEVATTPEP